MRIIAEYLTNITKGFKMKVSDAIKVLGLSGKFDMTDIKKAWRKLQSQYHPDKNPLGTEMCKIINDAYETLGKEDYSQEEVLDEPSDYLNVLEGLFGALLRMDDVSVEVCGSWVWVTGNTKPYRDILKEVGCVWASKKVAWYLRPEGERKRKFFGKVYTLDEIRKTHGSEVVRAAKQARVK